MSAVRRSGNVGLRRAASGTYSTLTTSVVRWLPGPRVLVNSVPKAGTHVVTQTLSHLPRVMYSGVHIQPETLDLVTGAEVATEPDDRALRKCRRLLGRVRDGQYATGHLPCWPAVADAVDDAHLRMLLVVRDPRDIAVSFAMYVTRLPEHHLHRYFTEELANDHDRIMASITGVPSRHGGPGLASIEKRVGGFAGWLTNPDVRLCKFESLIGARGGGDQARQLNEVAEIATFVGRPLEPAAARSVAAEVWSESSATFRRGVIGDWRRRFDADHRDAFHVYGGQLLIDLGYEESDDW